MSQWSVMQALRDNGRAGERRPAVTTTIYVTERNAQMLLEGTYIFGGAHLDAECHHLTRCLCSGEAQEMSIIVDWFDRYGPRCIKYNRVMALLCTSCTSRFIRIMEEASFKIGGDWRIRE